MNVSGDNFRHPSQITIGIFGEHVDSEWCNFCMLPSTVIVKQLLYDVDTLRLVGTRVVAVCDECGDWRFVSD